jgi:hypothetical protein
LALLKRVAQSSDFPFDLKPAVSIKAGASNKAEIAGIHDGPIRDFITNLVCSNLAGHPAGFKVSSLMATPRLPC